MLAKNYNKMSNENITKNLFENGMIKCSIYHNLIDEHKEKVDKILTQLKGETYNTSQNICQAVSEQLNEKSIVTI